MPKYVIYDVRDCVACGSQFRPKQYDHSFCSSKCRRNTRRESLKVTGKESLRLAIFERDGWVCQLCMEPIDRTLKHPDPMRASTDHVVPVAMGGKTSVENLQATHLQCNVKAATKNKIKNNYHYLEKKEVKKVIHRLKRAGQV